MSVPLKDLSKIAVAERTHRTLARIARNRDMHVSELVREILDEFVGRQIHNAKIVLGVDIDNGELADSEGLGGIPADSSGLKGIRTDSHGAPRRGQRK